MSILRLLRASNIVKNPRNSLAAVMEFVRKMRNTYAGRPVPFMPEMEIPLSLLAMNYQLLNKPKEELATLKELLDCIAQNYPAAIACHRRMAQVGKTTGDDNVPGSSSCLFLGDNKQYYSNFVLALLSRSPI